MNTLIHDRLNAVTPMNLRFTCFWLSLVTASATFVTIDLTFPLSTSSVIAQTVQESNTEAEKLVQQGIQQYESDRYQAAIESLNTALEISQKSGNIEGQANTLYHLGEAYYYYGYYFPAIDYYNKALTLYQAQGNKPQEAKTLTEIGKTYNSLREDIQAIQTLELALAIYEKIDNPLAKARTFNQIGFAYNSIENYPKAIEYLQASFAIYQQPSARLTQQHQLEFADNLYNLGRAYNKSGDYTKAEEVLQQALTIYEKSPDSLRLRYEVDKTKLLIALGYSFQGKITEMKEILASVNESLQENLTTYKKVGNQAAEAEIFNLLGGSHFFIQDLVQSINYYQQSLDIYTQLKYHSKQADALGKLAISYEFADQIEKSIGLNQQALLIYRRKENLYQSAKFLIKLGDNENFQRIHYKTALAYYEEALKNYQFLADSSFSKYYNFSSKYADLFADTGAVYANLGNTQKAIEYYSRAITNYLDSVNHKYASTKDYLDLGYVYFSLGEIYAKLVQYNEALNYFNQALDIAKSFQNESFLEFKRLEKPILVNLALLYTNLGQYQEAEVLRAEASKVEKEIEGRDVAGYILEKIEKLPNLAAYELIGKANELRESGQDEQALELYKQALEVSQEIKNKDIEFSALFFIGILYIERQQYELARHNHNQALVIARETDNKFYEEKILFSIGFSFYKENKPELVIIFLKQQINLIETIRQDNKELSEELQQSYTNAVTVSYRILANALLEQDRIYEAQRVLDLLKVQEINDYLQDTRGNENTSKGIPLTPQEQTIVTSYENLVSQAVSLGKELDILKKQEITPEKQKRINEIQQAQIQLNENFNNFIKTPEVVAAIQNTNIGTQDADFIDELSKLNRLPSQLKKLNAVLIYPLILEDRIELIITTPYSPPTRHTVKVSKKELNETILKFRQALQDPTSDPKPIANQLYQWLIQPLEQDLKTAEIKTIIYAPDGQLRYIPLAALYDGKQWLIERYQVNNITAMSLTDFDDQPEGNLQILAGAFSQGNYNFNIGQESFNFNGLPFAGKEVASLKDMIPNTVELLNNDFSKDNTTARMISANIVHLATHAAIVVGQPEDSFILFGNGDRVTLKEVENWQFDHIELMVFSACETGLGGNLGDGKEILGFGYLMKAKASIASLWSVSDGGTQALMTTFYTALQTPKTTKAEALQKAQIALITGNYEALGEDRGLTVRERISKDVPSDVSSRLSHPYYWSAFILIGNGL